MRALRGIRTEIAAAAQSLAEAGIDSAHNDAELLAAHLAGVDTADWPWSTGRGKNSSRAIAPWSMPGPDISRCST